MFGGSFVNWWYNIHMTLDELIKELQYNHTSYFHIYKHNIPTSVLSFSAGEFLGVISKARSSERAYEDFDKINTAVVLYHDFVDPDGADEMRRFLAGKIN
jgi:hypothetical protein